MLLRHDLAPAALYAVTVPQVQVTPASPEQPTQPASPEQPTQPTHRSRRRPLTVILAAAFAVAAAGCTHVKPMAHTTTTPPKRTTAVEQVVTTCIQNLYYNGLLPQAAAKTNCRYCVFDELEKLGVEPTPSQSQAAMIASAILSHPNLSTLQDQCNQADSF
jgi:hypothetical protein